MAFDPTPRMRQAGIMSLAFLLLLLGFMLWGVLPGMHMTAVAVIVAYGLIKK